MDTGEDEKPSISEVETKVEPKEKPSIENNVTESTSQEAIKIRYVKPSSVYIHVCLKLSLSEQNDIYKFHEVLYLYDMSLVSGYSIKKKKR